MTLPIETYEALQFAQEAHGNQKRKYTGEPYTNHCCNVAEIVAGYTDDIDIINAALLHDVIEDTSRTYEDIAERFGKRCADLVMEVTDVSKPEDGNREKRKQIDREHIAKCSSEGALIKLADLIDNTSTIVKYDPGFAKIYLQEKKLLLTLLTHGPANLHWRAVEVQREAVNALDHNASKGSGG